MPNSYSAEFCRGAIHVAQQCGQGKIAGQYQMLLAAAEAREALQGSKEKMALSRIHEIASRQLAEPAGAGDAVAMAKICTEVEAVWLPPEATQPTAVEVIEACREVLANEELRGYVALTRTDNELRRLTKAANRKVLEWIKK